MIGKLKPSTGTEDKFMIRPVVFVIEKFKQYLTKLKREGNYSLLVPLSLYSDEKIVNVHVLTGKG
jgi:hypothetical protein